MFFKRHYYIVVKMQEVGLGPVPFFHLKNPLSGIVFALEVYH